MATFYRCDNCKSETEVAPYDAGRYEVECPGCGTVCCAFCTSHPGRLCDRCQEIEDWIRPDTEEEAARR